MRDCPKCFQLTEPDILGGVELDRCGSCQGILLDMGELEELIRERVPGASMKGATARVIDTHPAHCVECNRGMAHQMVSGVRIEVCPGCGLVFLDKGELAAIQAANRGR